MISPDDLRIVAAVSLAGSVEAAARTLRVHPATVYRRLTALERGLGRPAFERGAGGLLPTPLGEELAAAWREVDARLGELDRRVQAHDGRLEGELVVTTTDSLLPVVLSALPSFRTDHPAVSIRVVVTNPIADMGRREADVAVRPTVSPPETLWGRRLAPFSYAVYGPDPAAPAIALDGPLADIPSAVWWRTNGGSSPALTVNGMWAAAVACSQGLGRAVLPSYMEGVVRLRRLSAPVPELQSSVWLLFHPEVGRSPRVRLFTRAIGPVLAMALASPRSEHED